MPREYTTMYAAIRRKPPEEQQREYRRIAQQHILHRPDLFVVRTLSRVRSYFGFDTSTGSSARQGYGANTLEAVAIILADLIFYGWIVMGMLLYLFVLNSKGIEGWHTSLLLGLILFYSLPYWLSFAHPTYHFPVLPLMAVFAAGAFSKKRDDPSSWQQQWRQLQGHSKRRFVIVVIVIILIQIEWGWIAGRSL